MGLEILHIVLLNGAGSGGMDPRIIAAFIGVAVAFISVGIALYALFYTVLGRTNTAAEERGRQSKAIEVIEVDMKDVKTKVEQVPVINQIVKSTADQMDKLVDKMEKMGEKVEKIAIKMEKVVQDTKEMGGKMLKLSAGTDVEIKSPVQLSETGEEIVKSSGIREVIAEYQHMLLERIKITKPINAFQCQEALFQEAKMLRVNPKLTLRLQQIAYSSGRDVDTMLYLGAIDIRDDVLKEFKFDPAHVDYDDPESEKTA